MIGNQQSSVPEMMPVLNHIDLLMLKNKFFKFWPSPLSKSSLLVDSSMIHKE